MLENFKQYFQKNTQLSDEQFAILSKNVKSEKVNKHTFLLKPGEICKYSFFVEEGLLRSYTIDKTTGKEHIIQFGSENWIVSDRSSAYFNEPSDFYVDAIEDSAIVFFDADFTKKAADMSPLFRQYNEKALHNHIRHLQKRINLLLSTNAEQRYMDFIKLYPDILLRVPQWMVASYLGITPESLSRVRKELANRHFKPL
jgi:CRP-like cAMP-binding protein